MGKPLQKWRSRHQNPVSFWLHMLGIPLTILAAALAILSHWLVAISLFVGGYALQFIGHAIEGTPSGEGLLLRRLLGMGGDKPVDKPIHRRRRPR